jgi:hypothetical protein
MWARLGAWAVPMPLQVTAVTKLMTLATRLVRGL